MPAFFDPPKNFAPPEGWVDLTTVVLPEPPHFDDPQTKTFRELGEALRDATTSSPPAPPSPPSDCEKKRRQAQLIGVGIGLGVGTLLCVGVYFAVKSSHE